VLFLTANVCELSRKAKVIIVDILIILQFVWFGCEHIPHANNISGNARIHSSNFRILGRFLATRKWTWQQVRDNYVMILQCVVFMEHDYADVCREISLTKHVARER
jgi:hypothetical protein